VGRVVVVIGVGNEFRRDDAAGPAVVTSLRGRVPPGVELVLTDGEPTRLIEAWTGAALAVVVDAVRADPPRPGRVRSARPPSVTWTTREPSRRSAAGAMSAGPAAPASRRAGAAPPVYGHGG
jgi:hydrogenase maturation protease